MTLSLVGFLGISVQVPVLIGIDLFVEGELRGVVLLLTGLCTLVLVILWSRWLLRLRSRLIARAP